MSRELYYNGTILTAVDAFPKAAGILVEDGRILEVIREFDGEAERLYPDAKPVDLQGKTLVPGFIDGHSHFLQNILELKQLNAKPAPLGEANSVEELVKTLKEQLNDPIYADQEYLHARGYDEAVYPDHRIPTRFDLDQVTTKPLVLDHASGHNSVFNSAALALANITDDYEPGPDGSVGRFEDGTLTGLFHENARRDVLPKTKADIWEEFEQGIEQVTLLYSSKGVTTAQDGATPREWHDYVQRLAEEGKLKIDLVSYVLGEGTDELITAKEPQNYAYKNHYRVAGKKFFLDGSPQAKTAWLTKPYHIPPEGRDETYRGYGIYTDEQLLLLFEEAIRNHWQINVHTNGDEAIEQLIRVYGEALKKTGVTQDLRPVSIHCQTVREDQLDRIKELGILVSFFVDHTYYWGDYHASAVLGEERAVRISPLASAIRRGISFSLHQDTPVTSQNPLFAIHNAVNRKTRSGRVLGEEYRISAWEALKAVTIQAAYQLFEEKEKGSIEAGKRADFAILDKNPLTVPADTIKDIQVVETIKDGCTIYRK